MLGDQDGNFLVLELGKDFGRLTFERGDEFGTHGVILKWHLSTSKLRVPRECPVSITRSIVELGSRQCLSAELSAKGAEDASWNA